MRRWVLVLATLAIAGSIFSVGRAKGEGGGAPTVCRSDVAKLCTGVKPGGGRLLRCLDQHRDKVSKPCGDALGGADKGGGEARSGPAKYSTLQFTLLTGSDDLRGDSQAWALVQLPKGPVKTCVLHVNGQDSFQNGSVHVIGCELGAAFTVDQLRHVKISVAYEGLGIGATEGQDNWNLNTITINAYAEDKPPICIFSAAGNPLYRFQGAYAAVPGGKRGFAGAEGMGWASDGVVVTDLPGRC